MALAAPGDGDSGGCRQRLGLADAQPAGIGPLSGPAKSFQRTIRIGVHRIRVARRARLRRERREAFAALPGGVSQATLDAIGACESGGNPTAVSSDGSYRGKYQFDYGTWESVGGSGDPAAAPEARAGLPRCAALRPIRFQPLARLRLAARGLCRPQAGKDLLDEGRPTAFLP